MAVPEVIQSAVIRHLLPVLFGAALGACAQVPPPETAAPDETVPKPSPAAQDDERTAPAARPRPPVPAAPSPESPPATTALRAADWTELPNWEADDHASALKAFLQGCAAIGPRPAWRATCDAARKIAPGRIPAARRFFETHFRPYRVTGPENDGTGLITGYYEPILNGSRTRSARYRYPLYAVPDDLLVVELAELHPDLKGLRLRGRLEGRRVVPYYSRAEIDGGIAPRIAPVLFWVDDPIDLFFLQVQGSGQIRLDNGERARVGFADQNGHPYRSIGRLLVERGELTLENASMQGIKAWARQHPDKLPEVLHHNARYVFFRELRNDLPGPIGALGVPLTAGRSLAIDPAHVPLGAPVFLDTTWPNSKRPLQRLMMAQDTGGAIRGPARGDYFWGLGEQAGTQAGRMRQSGRMWILAPNGAVPEALFSR